MERHGQSLFGYLRSLISKSLQDLTKNKRNKHLMNYGKTCNPLFNLQGIGTTQEEEQRELHLKNRCVTIFKHN
jgi:hypothetical protein